MKLDNGSTIRKSLRRGIEQLEGRAPDLHERRTQAEQQRLRLRKQASELSRALRVIGGVVEGGAAEELVLKKRRRLRLKDK